MSRLRGVFRQLFPAVFYAFKDQSLRRRCRPGLSSAFPVDQLLYTFRRTESAPRLNQCAGDDPDHVVEEPVPADPERDQVARPLHVQAENIGRIAVFYDEDIFFYDNLRTGVVYMFEGATSSWREISPVGKYRLVGIDGQDIYVAELNRDDKVVAAYRGRLRQGFTKIATYKTPEDFSKLTLNSMLEASDKMESSGDTNK